MSNIRVLVQFQLVITVSAPSEKNRKSGRRLTKNASLTAVLTWSRAQLSSFGVGEKVVRSG